MNINGKNGPTLKQIFTCEGCKWIGHSVFSGYGKNPFHCYNDEFVQKYSTNYNLMIGDIGEEMITPEFCPVLIKRIRNEKLKEINEYRRTEKEIT